MGLQGVLGVAQATVFVLVINSRMVDAMKVFPLPFLSAVNAREWATRLYLFGWPDAAA